MSITSEARCLSTAFLMVIRDALGKETMADMRHACPDSTEFGEPCRMISSRIATRCPLKYTSYLIIRQPETEGLDGWSWANSEFHPGALKCCMCGMLPMHVFLVTSMLNKQSNAWHSH